MLAKRTAAAMGVALLTLCVSTTVVSAQEAPGTAQEKVEVTREGFVSLDFREADIRNVLQILALKSGVNIVTAPEVTGAVTIQLNDVPWKQALDVILSTYGYAYEQRGNIIVVTTVEKLKQQREDALILAEQEPLITETFVLNFANAARVIESVEKMKSERGTVNYDERTNTIIVTDIRSKLDLIAGVVKKLDRTTPQVLIETKIVETRLNDTEQLGIDWTVQATVTGTERAHTYPFTTSSDNKYTPDSIPAADGDDFTVGTLNFNQMKAVLNLLENKTDTNILSNPRIVTTDNQPAIIQVGDENPIPTYGNHPETGVLQVAGLEYRNIGINFEVTPHVNSAGFVTLDIKPEVSETNGSVVFETINVPIITTRKVSTSIMVKDGDTIVIGGLIEDQVVDTKRKVPILGHIPVVGLLFQSKNKTITKRDLIIFLTPHIITPEIASK